MGYEEDIAKLEAMAGSSGSVPMYLSRTFRAGPIAITYETPTVTSMASVEPGFERMIRDKGKKKTKDFDLTESMRMIHLISRHITKFKGINIQDRKTDWEGLSSEDKLWLLERLAFIAPAVLEAFIEEFTDQVIVDRADVLGSDGSRVKPSKAMSQTG